MTILQLLTLLLLIPNLAFAGWINKNGEKLPDAENRKSIGGFGAQLIVVGDENELFKRWATSSDTVDVKTIDSIKVNGFINTFVVFSGCKPDVKGNCNVSMQFRVIQPDGKVYIDTPPMEVWEDKPSPQGRTLELSVQYLKLLIEPKDQLGRYVIYALVRDNNTDAVLNLQLQFTASKDN
jgi:hypothetical protein